MRHAREGIAVSAGQRRVTAAAADLFSGAADADVRRSLWPIYHPDRLAAERFVQADLATTLSRVARDGAEEFYRGALARRIAEAAAAAGSPLAAADFAEHRADWVEPLRLRYRGGEAVTLPPPTQGFAALSILALLEGFDVAALVRRRSRAPRPWRPPSSRCRTATGISPIRPSSTSRSRAAWIRTA